MAGIAREDYLLEGANADLERGRVAKTDVVSDIEDGYNTNKVQYSYIDYELFTNED